MSVYESMETWNNESMETWVNDSMETWNNESVETWDSETQTGSTDILAHEVTALMQESEVRAVLIVTEIQPHIDNVYWLILRGCAVGNLGGGGGGGGGRQKDRAGESRRRCVS